MPKAVAQLKHAWLLTPGVSDASCAESLPFLPELEEQDCEAWCKGWEC
jgi:hypothetical protein